MRCSYGATHVGHCEQSVPMQFNKTSQHKRGHNQRTFFHELYVLSDTYTYVYCRSVHTIDFSYRENSSIFKTALAEAQPEDVTSKHEGVSLLWMP